MIKKRILIPIILIVTATAVFLGVRYTFRASESSVASERAEASIGASELLRLYETYEDSANQLYLGKVIAVTGIVDSYREDSLSVSVYLKDPEDFSGVTCVFDKSLIDASSFQPGTEASIKGICSGYLFDVILNRCALAD